MAGRAAMGAFAGKCQQIFLPSVRAFDTDEAMVQITTVKVAVDKFFFRFSLFLSEHSIVMFWENFYILEKKKRKQLIVSSIN